MLWCYGLFMPLPPPSLLAARLNNIKDVADDLSRELFRVRCHPTGAIYDMALFIKAEAESALSALKKPPRALRGGAAVRAVSDRLV